MRSLHSRLSVEIKYSDIRGLEYRDGSISYCKFVYSELVLYVTLSIINGSLLSLSDRKMVLRINVKVFGEVLLLMTEKVNHTVEILIDEIVVDFEWFWCEFLDEYLIRKLCHTDELQPKKAAQSQEKDMVIKKLKKRIKSLNGKQNEDKIKKGLEEIETINIELDHRVTKLIAENEHLKQTYKQLYDSIEPARIRSKEQCDDLINQVNIKSAEISDLNASLQEKALEITAFADADHAGCQDTRRSTSGSMQLLG
ncbi:hypothetical protein Tco_0237359, partial [Tanacetum coccineum]